MHSYVKELWLIILMIILRAVVMAHPSCNSNLSCQFEQVKGRKKHIRLC